jgi:hypothetical protein
LQPCRLCGPTLCLAVVSFLVCFILCARRRSAVVLAVTAWRRCAVACVAFAFRWPLRLVCGVIAPATILQARLQL